MMSQKGDLYVKMFSTISGVRTVGYICTRPAKPCDTKNNDSLAVHGDLSWHGHLLLDITQARSNPCVKRSLLHQE